MALLVDVLVVGALWNLGRRVAELLPEPNVARAFAISYGLVVPAAYVVLGHGLAGRTVGKAVTGLRVVGPASGEPPGVARALARLALCPVALSPVAPDAPAAAWVWLLIGGVGGLLAFARRDRRGLHDLVAGTRVVAGPARAPLSPAAMMGTEGS